jgi:hypothetical protein
MARAFWDPTVVWKKYYAARCVEEQPGPAGSLLVILAMA